MPIRYKTYNDFSGGINNVLDAKDLAPTKENPGPMEWAELQNVSVEKRGVARTMGALAAHDEVPSQSAVIAPGSGLYVYSSDHSETALQILNLLPADNATSDQGGEVNAVGSWAIGADLTATSVADTDGGAIASNGTSYILKLTADANINTVCEQDYATIIGQRYAASVDMYNRTMSDYMRVVVFVVATSEILYLSSYQTAASWITHYGEFIATATSTRIRVNVSCLSGEISYLDKIYVTKAPSKAFSGDWLALSDVASAQIDLYSDNDDAFSSGALDFGDVSTYVGTIDKINFPTTNTITDANGGFLNNNMQPGQMWKISNAETAANDVLIILTRVTSGTLYVRGTPLTVDADDNNAVTFTKYNSTSFHFVDEALRASPTTGGIVLRPKHYSFVDRIHFFNAIPLTIKDDYASWFLNDIGPKAPTDQYVETTDSGGSRDITSDVDAGEGFEVAVTSNANDGEWVAKTWEVATTFIYDGGQESALYIPSTAQTFATADSDSLDVAIRAHNTGTSYDERISGGRAYCRINLSDDPWALFVDIDMKQGSRATLSGTYNTWQENTGIPSVVHCDGFDSFRLNPDTYESLTGLDPSNTRELFDEDNKYWDTSAIGGNRCFLASARYTDSGGATVHFADRILYSQPGAYDVFPVGNFIDVVRGDADDYVKLVFYKGFLLAFKQRNLFVLDVSDPNPALWYLKDTFPFRGILHAGAVAMTPFGPAWSNEHGCFVYDGNRIVDLTRDKIASSTWPGTSERLLDSSE